MFYTAHERRGWIVGVGAAVPRRISLSLVRKLLRKRIDDDEELETACEIVDGMDADWLKLSSDREAADAERERKRVAEREAHEREAKARGLEAS